MKEEITLSDTYNKIESAEDAARWINENFYQSWEDTVTNRVWNYAYSALCRNIVREVKRDEEGLICPHCEETISGGRPHNNWKFCPICGQAISWKEVSN